MNINDNHSKKVHFSKERRKEEVLIFISQSQKTVTGLLIERKEKSVRISTSELGLKVGQKAELLIVTSSSKEKQKGIVKSCVERIDRRKPGSLFYIFEIDLTGIFLA